MYAIVDIETTGGNAMGDSITEIAILLHDGEEVVDSYSTLVNPERRIPYRITAITGISNEMVGGAPKFYEVARKIVELTDGRTLVAHNAKFDYGFIRNAFKSLGFDYKREVLCTVEMSRKLLPGRRSYQLGQLCRDLGIETHILHRAMADAEATARLFTLLRGLSEKRGGGTENAELRTASQMSRMNPDANLKKDQIDKLPNATGVYYFYDVNHQLIYVGKSVDIRSRVLSHFANNTNAKAVDMKAHIEHIRYAVTGSELVALLKESEEIKQCKPLYNRAQRRSRYPVGLYASHDAEGYLQFRWERMRRGAAEPVAAFTTLAEARGYIERMLDQHQLCQRHMGVQKGKGPCFYFGLHKCLGACAGREDAASYNERAQKVVEGLQYLGQNLYIVGEGRTEGEKSLVLIERGKYVGYGYLEAEFLGSAPSVLRQCITPFFENKDVRQIINLFLRQGKAEQLIEF